MTDFPRLIEHAFSLKRASLDSVHENVRVGHNSTPLAMAKGGALIGAGQTLAAANRIG